MIQIVKKSPSGPQQKQRYKNVSISELKTCAARIRELSTMVDGIIKSSEAIGLDGFDKISGGARIANATDSLLEVFGEISGKLSIAMMRQGRRA